MGAAGGRWVGAGMSGGERVDREVCWMLEAWACWGPLSRTGVPGATDWYLSDHKS